MPARRNLQENTMGSDAMTSTGTRPCPVGAKCESPVGIDPGGEKEECGEEEEG